MSSPKPYQILTALQTQLETITIGNGYNHDVSSVHLGIRNVNKVNDRPALDIASDGTSHERFEGSINTVSEMSLVIRGYLDPTRDAEEKMWDLVEDVCDALSSNITLGLDFVFDTRYEETATDNGLELLDRFPRMIFVLITVHYEHGDEEF